LECTLQFCFKQNGNQLHINSHHALLLHRKNADLNLSWKQFWLNRPSIAFPSCPLSCTQTYVKMGLWMQNEHIASTVYNTKNKIKVPWICCAKIVTMYWQKKNIKLHLYIFTTLLSFFSLFVILMWTEHEECKVGPSEVSNKLIMLRSSRKHDTLTSNKMHITSFDKHLLQKYFMFRSMYCNDMNAYKT
jgi:hypothetical protein